MAVDILPVGGGENSKTRKLVSRYPCEWDRENGDRYKYSAGGIDEIRLLKMKSRGSRKRKNETQGSFRLEERH